jgi:hypothetical protein
MRIKGQRKASQEDQSQEKSELESATNQLHPLLLLLFRRRPCAISRSTISRPLPPSSPRSRRNRRAQMLTTIPTISPRLLADRRFISRVSASRSCFLRLPCLRRNVFPALQLFGCQDEPVGVALDIAVASAVPLCYVRFFAHNSLDGEMRIVGLPCRLRHFCRLLT